jgi:hypothetical protein
MREVLYRGKLKHDINPQKPAGSWVYGGCYFWKNGYCIHEDNSCIGLFVDPETVGGFTGLKDHLRNRIFEGDIVEYQGSIYVVRHTKILCAFEMYKIEDDFKMKGMYLINSLIIGNIHDNKELLEAKA